MRRYNPKEIEPKWQKIWAESGIYKTDMKRTADKAYVIPMLPYPSGDLHIGHWYNYGPTDTVARFRRMLGQNVFTTLGFDAFGLPAENAAIKRGIQPAVWTHSNIGGMTTQIKQIGTSYDWDHALATCDPDFYRWNQWLFLKLYEKGLAYQAKAVVNWCPKDQTVLANEQVVGEDNVCERCGTPVVQKEMESWYFKITDYTERLLADLDTVDWPNKVKVMQQNWIGKSRGALIDFKVDTKADYVLLHGYAGGSKNNFFPWAAGELKKTGSAVYVPDMPNSAKPDAKEQAEFVLKNHEFSNDTILLGHSYGSVTALRIVEQLKKPIKKLVLVAGFAQPGLLVPEKNFEKTTDWEFDFDKIKQNAGEVVILRASNDSAVPQERSDFIQEKIGGRIVDFNAEGNHVTAEIEPAVLQNLKMSIEVFTTRPDTIYGATYIVLAPEHHLVKQITTDECKGRVEQYIEETARKTELERKEEKHKTGAFTGAYAINPANKKKIPIWVADYVLPGYGTGAIMAVPAHDDRDWEFAQKFNLSIDQVIEPNPEETIRISSNLPAMVDYIENEPTDKKIKRQIEANVRQINSGASWYSGEGKLKNSDKYDGMDSAEAREKITAELGKPQTNYKLRDWLISRQRYWGTPIPIIYCDKCGTVPVPEADLPVILPEDVEFELSGRSPLGERPDFVDAKCPNCGGPAKRETDTMDTFVDSSWYFLRYVDNKNAKAAFDTELVNQWLPVDHYIGGIEHAILHLLYARFITKFLHDKHGLAFEEPFKKLTNQGIILGPDGHKMSKSRGNVVSPDEQVTSYGADSLRLYLMFMGPYDQGGPYDLGGIAGTRRFLDRLWTLAGEFQEAGSGTHQKDVEITAAVHKTIKKVTKDLETLSFNTAIAAMMELVNTLYKIKAEEPVSQSVGWRFGLETLTQLLAPFAPHIAEELWGDLGHETSVHISNWPLWDEKLVAEEVITLAVQINGKVRSEIVVETDISEEDAIKAAKEDDKITPLLAGKTVKKAIYVPGRLVSLVV